MNAKYYFYCSNPACKKSSQGTTEEATFDKPNTALTHNWVNPVNNNNGTHTYSCSQSNTDGWVCDETNTLNCEDSKTLVSVKAPTCTAVGYTTYKCTICEYTWKADETDPLGHDYSQQIKDTAHIKEAATCENGDIYWYDCSRCDKNAKNEEDTDRYTNLTYQVNNKRAHKWQNKVDAKYLASEATCTAAAKYYTSCAYDDCGKSSEEVNGAGKGVKFSDGKALGHDWIKPEAIDKYKASDADCVTDATYYYICSRADKCGCESSKGIKKDGETWTLENSKTGHDFDHANGHKAATAATCTTAGNYEYYLCEKCDKYFKDADGKEAFSGQSATVIKALGHDIVTVTYVKPTCETDGTPAHKYCKRCDYTTMPSDLSAYKAKGHNFAGALKYDSENDYHSYLCLNKCGESGMIIDGVQTKYAVAENGTVTGGEKCTFSNNVSHYTGTDGKNYHAVSCKCGNKDSELCADTTPEVIAPTCSMDGYTLNTCEDCGYTWKTDVVSKETHTPEFTTVPNGDGSHTIKCIVCGDETLVACSGGTATCKDYAKCSVCGGEYGKKPGHTLSADGWVSNNNATCTADGTKSQNCSACGEKITEADVNSKLGHDMSAYSDFVPEKLKDTLADANIVIKAPTCKEEGFTLSYCSRCDVYKTKTEPRNTNAHVFPLDANGEIDYTPVGGNCATGVTMKAVCSVCLAEKTKVESVAHTWKVVEKVAAGCVDNGFIKYACTACPATRTLDEVTMVEIEEIKDEDGNVSYKFDDVIVSAADYNDVVAKGKHTLGDLVTVKEATCGRDGKGYRICSVCPEKVEEVIYATGEHRMTVNKGKAATCTTMGWEDYESCVVCGMEEEMTYIAATGHVDGNNDNVCDSCKGQLGNVVVEKEDGCICHKDSGFMKFMYKFLLFFWKLFKTNKTCLCGAEHY